MTTLCMMFCPADLKREMDNYAREKAFGKGQPEKEVHAGKQEDEMEEVDDEDGFDSISIAHAERAERRDECCFFEEGKRSFE